MSTVIKPTIGRVVWYWPVNDVQELAYYDDSQPLSAQVVYVCSDSYVNLQVLDQDGTAHSRSSVPLRQEGEERPGGSFCEWMPYQIGQAAKRKEQST